MMKVLPHQTDEATWMSSEMFQDALTRLQDKIVHWWLSDCTRNRFGGNKTVKSSTCYSAWEIFFISDADMLSAVRALELHCLSKEKCFNSLVVCWHTQSREPNSLSARTRLKARWSNVFNFDFWTVTWGLNVLTCYSKSCTISLYQSEAVELQTIEKDYYCTKCFTPL